jgi:Peroxidase
MWQALVGTPAEGAVSAADLVALAGARAVRITGGPAIDVPIGGQLETFMCAVGGLCRTGTIHQ